MSSDIRIRRALVSEAPALTDLAMRSKALWGYDDRFMAMCLEEMTIRPEAIEAGEVWVAEGAAGDGGGILGLLELIPEGRSTEVRMIFVEPGLVRSGVGRALWRHAEARARVHGAARLALDADPNAVPFYERMGMRIVGESPSGSIPGRMLPRMEKELGEGRPRSAKRSLAQH